MSKILCIQASPRTERSYCRAAADAFVETYRAAHPEDEVETIDVFTMDLPAFDGLTVQAKYTILHGKQHTDEELAAWKDVERVIDQFKAADKYVLAVPMWNFGVPYRFKQYLDVILQPGYTFAVTAEGGYEGLITGKPAVVAYARGGAYGEGTGLEYLDHQKPYVELALGFMGFTDVKTIVLEPTLAGGPDAAAQQRESAIAEARRLAGEF